jgi:RNA polymerase sigma-70 factor (ECF subfamily)
LSHSLPIPRPFGARRRPDGPSDEDLIAAWRDGDHPAFNLLFERYRDRVVAYAWRMLRNGEEAEEITTEAFCRVLEGAWRPGGSFRAFLFTVAHRLCIDRLRKRERTARFERLWRAAAPPQRTPEQAAADDERQRAVELALAELPPAHRATVLLYYGQELRSREVAEILGCTDQQVRSRLSYARKCLRSVLDDRDLEDGPRIDA